MIQYEGAGFVSENDYPKKIFTEPGRYDYYYIVDPGPLFSDTVEGDTIAIHPGFETEKILLDSYTIINEALYRCGVLDEVLIVSEIVDDNPIPI